SRTQTGRAAAVTNNGEGTFTLTAHWEAYLAGLTITRTSELEGPVSGGLPAVAHDGSSPNTATGTPSTTLVVDPFADTPTITASRSEERRVGRRGRTRTPTNPADMFKDATDSVVMTVSLSDSATLRRTGTSAAV